MGQQLEKVTISNDDGEEIEIDLLELLFYYRIKLGIILTVFFICAGISALVTVFFITPRFQATSKLYMVSASNDSVVDLTDLNLGTSLSSDYEELLKIRPIFEEIIEEKSLRYEYEELLDMIDISAIEDTRILVITAECTDPMEAKIIANALADKAVSYLPEVMETDPPNIAERAISPEEKSSPSLSKNTVIGALAGTAVCLIVLTVLFVMDDTLKSAEDVEKAFGIMPLTVIPEGDIAEIRDEGKSGRKKRKDRRKKRRKARAGGNTRVDGQDYEKIDY